ncbi:hypothetical protein [Acinetobacter colistiniresistens]|uniref:Spore coat protein U domain-containing protein n=1 Tax=Acinetobacter colistiniresistens TaxID=280145 RepID=A0A558EUM9_9GAMM|nr:hypothetical protein [Acinetobacter colistiniresistens]TVT77111.1 hypothetical protein FPV60_19515 [Acinetobacter colistiniresistens]
MFKNIIFILILAISSTTFAAESISNRKIIDIGCHISSDTCFVTLSGPVFGSLENCTYTPTNEFRFSGGTTSGKRTYASLLTAFISKKTVDVYITGCYGGWATLEFFHIR